MSDPKLLDKGSKDYRELKRNTIIFICAEDKYKKGKPKYTFVCKEKDSNEEDDDGKSYIYVNGEYNGNHPIADIVHDMKCSNPEDCRLQIFKNTLRYYKKQKGEIIMSEKVQRFIEEAKMEMRDELEQEVRKKVTQQIKQQEEQNRLLGLIFYVKNAANSLNLSVENAMNILGVSPEDRTKLIQMM